MFRERELRESAGASMFFPARCPNGCSLFVVFPQGGGQAFARVVETVWSTLMPKFLFIYRESTESRAKPSPEKMKALGAAWYAWMQKFSESILPGGDGLKPSGRVIKAGIVTDGPHVEAKEVIVSFTIIQADDYDAGAGDCPCMSARPHDRDPRIGRLRIRRHVADRLRAEGVDCRRRGKDRRW